LGASIPGNLLRANLFRDGKRGKKQNQQQAVERSEQTTGTDAAPPHQGQIISGFFLLLSYKI
jgi:hypothetical protein